MSELRNPAGRLYALLQRFEQEKQEGGSGEEVWARTLLVPQSEVFERLGEVLKLIREVRLAALGTERPAFADIPSDLDVLRRAIAPSNTRFTASADAFQVDPTAMRMLASLSAFLEDSRPDGIIPSGSELADLCEQLDELREALLRSPLPAEVKRALLERVRQMLEALESIDIGGPDAVRAAAEALAAATIVREPDVPKQRDLMRRLRRVAAAAFVAVSIPGDVEGGLSMGDRLGLLSGPGVAAQKAIEAPKDEPLERKRLERPDGERAVSQDRPEP